MDTRRIARRFSLAFGVLAALAYVAGGARVLDALAGVDGRLVAFAVGSSLVSFVCFMEVFVGTARVVEPRLMQVRRVYLVGTFVRKVLPWGNLASATLGAFLLSRGAKTGYERALAGVAAHEFVTTATSVVAVAVGTTFALTGGPGSELATLAAATASAGTVFVVGVLVIAHTRPRWLTDTVYSGTGILQRAALTVSPAASSALDRANVSARLSGFDRTVRTIATDRSRLTVTVALSLLAWAALGTALHYATGAVGVSLSLPAAIAVTPILGLVKLVPLPGGVGSVDAALVGLLVAATGVSLPLATAATLLYRLVTFWLHLGISGVAVALSPDALTSLR